MNIFRKISDYVKFDTKNILQYLIFAVILLYCTSIPCFSAIRPYNYITIVLSLIMVMLITTYCLLYSKIIFDWFSILLFVFNLAIIFSDISNDASKYITTYLTLSFVSFFVYQFCRANDKIWIIMDIIYVSFIFFAFYFSVFYRNCLFDFSIDRIGDHFDNLNTVAYYFVFAGCLSLAHIKRNNILSWLNIILFTIFLFLCIRTGSRSALLCFLLSFIVFIFILFGKKRLWISSIIVIGTIVISIVCLEFIPQLNSIKERLDDFIMALLGSEKADGSSKNRIELVGEAIEMFFRKPFIGWGTNSFSNFSSERLFSHNNFAELMISYGLIPPIVFNILILYPLYRVIKTRKNSKEFVWKSIVLLLISVFAIQAFYVNSQLKFEYIFISIGSSLAKTQSVDNKKYISNLEFERINL